MKTIGYGLIQIPIVKRYRVCCIKRTLAGGVTSTGWQQIIGGVIRILLLSSWGLQSVDYTLPQTAEKMIGVYVEFTLLGLQVTNGILVLFGLWSDNVYLLYPSVVTIPVSFVTDVIVKATCYAALFLTPNVTSFGILSLVEVWLRGLGLMYGWIIIISYLYYKEKECELPKVDVQLNMRSPGRVSALVRRTSSNNPFSRNSSLSKRGRQSFLIRKASAKGKKEDCETGGEFQPPSQHVYSEPLLTPESQTNSEDRLASTSGRDGESDIQLGESATMSLKRSIPSHSGSHRDGLLISTALNHNGSHPVNIERSAPSKYRKIGGFFPTVLRTPSVNQSNQEPLLPANSARYRESPTSSTTRSTNSACTVEFERPVLEQTGTTATSGKDAPEKQASSSGQSSYASSGSRRLIPPGREKIPERNTAEAKRTAKWGWRPPVSKKDTATPRKVGGTTAPPHNHLPEPVLV